MPNHLRRNIVITSLAAAAMPTFAGAGTQQTKVVVLTGSPHREGTTDLLADRFCKGARDAGHAVERFDLAFMDVKRCIGCFHCLKNNGICIHQDDGPKILDAIEAADVVILVTPIYYYAISSALKTLLERFTARRTKFMKLKKRLGLMAVCGGPFEWSFDSINVHVDSLCRYLHWENAGRLCARGFGKREQLAKSDFPDLAEEFGRKLMYSTPKKLL